MIKMTNCVLLKLNHTLEIKFSLCVLIIFFSLKNCLYLKWQSFIGRCLKNDNHPQENLIKFDYKSKTKYKSLIIFLYVWLHDANHICEYVPPLFGDGKSPKSLII